MRPVNDRISHFMTRFPHTIAVDRTLEHAHRILREHRIRHLPVVAGGKLVGVVSERDLHLLETIKGTDPLQATVEEAMSPNVFSVHPNTRLSMVARKMAERKLGSAVVMNRGQVLGIFTAIDGLRLLSRLTTRSNRSPHPKSARARSAGR